MNVRFKELRKVLGLSQEEFGKKLGITKSGISDIESGRRNVTEQHIIMLCNSDPHINEEWLRTGQGNMFLELNRNDEIASFMADVQLSDDDSFQKRFIAMLTKLDVSDWEVLEKMVNEMSKK